MTEIIELWKNYNISSEQLRAKLGRTSNLVGEYAEYLIKEYLNGEMLTASSASADIKAPNGELYQVKARKITDNLTTQLSIIRSWDFDFLALILFDKNGSVLKSLICPKAISKQYAVYNEHQNGWVISTTEVFLNDHNNIDITLELREINKDFLIEGYNKLKSQETSEVFKKQNKSDQSFKKKELKIGKYVQRTFTEIIGEIDRIELENLQRQDYSKLNFDIQFPFLRKVTISEAERPLRYWKEPVIIFGEKYYMCSEWYEKEPNNDRPYYEKWLNKIKNKKGRQK